MQREKRFPMRIWEEQVEKIPRAFTMNWAGSSTHDVIWWGRSVTNQTEWRAFCALADLRKLRKSFDADKRLSPESRGFRSIVLFPVNSAVVFQTAIHCFKQLREPRFTRTPSTTMQRTVTATAARHHIKHLHHAPLSSSTSWQVFKVQNRIKPQEHNPHNGATLTAGWAAGNEENHRLKTAEQRNPSQLELRTSTARDSLWGKEHFNKIRSDIQAARGSWLFNF